MTSVVVLMIRPSRSLLFQSIAFGIGRGFRSTCEDVAPGRAFVVYSGDGRYPLDVEVIGLREMARLLRGAQDVRGRHPPGPRIRNPVLQASPSKTRHP